MGGFDRMRTDREEKKKRSWGMKVGIFIRIDGQLKSGTTQIKKKSGSSLSGCVDYGSLGYY